jgi:hypothetical protein
MFEASALAEGEELGSNILHSTVLLTYEYEDASEKWHKLTRAGLEWPRRVADRSRMNMS